MPRVDRWNHSSSNVLLYVLGAIVAISLAVPSVVRCGPPQQDSMPPSVVPDEPSGSWGHSRLTFTRSGDEIIATLVEGPREGAVRCQRQDLPCSYLDLTELRDSGKPVPAELEITAEELNLLVEQLDSLSHALGDFTSADDACSAGYEASGAQAVNMGIHFVNGALVSDGVFDPTRPEILLFAKPGGELLAKNEVGECVDGRWTGEPSLELVGSAFQLPTNLVGENHPNAFAGPLDNWHVHYNICMMERADTVATEEQCLTAGGKFVEKAGWMIHAYVVPEFDNQAGVFAMWNPEIWPTDVAGLIDSDRAPSQTPQQTSEIREAQFEPVVELLVGETLAMRNADYLPHTVTSLGKDGKPLFDSGQMMTGDEFLIRLEEAGEYEYFCRYHRFMRGKIIVR